MNKGFLKNEKDAVNIFSEIFETYRVYNGTIVEEHIQKLRELDSYFPPMNSYFIVSNTTKKSYEFVSSNFERTLGLDKQKMLKTGMSYFFSHIHPDELTIWIEVIKGFMNFTMNEINIEDRNRLSYSWNYRARNIQGDYLNIIEHQTPTFFDDYGKPIIGIGHSSVIGKGEQRSIIASVKKLNDNNEYETIYYKNYSQKLLSESVSNREKDVIRLLALNNTSKQIGEKLFISPHTVDEHRRNILKKLSFNSTKELVQHCLVNQFF